MSDVVSLRGKSLPKPGKPDSEVCRLAQDVFERALSGDINGLVVVYACVDGSTGTDSAGQVNIGVLGGLQIETKRVGESLDD